MANRVWTLSLALCCLTTWGCLTLWSCGRAEEPAPKQPAAAQPAATPPQPAAQQAVVAEGYLRNLPRKNVNDLTYETSRTPSTLRPGTRPRRARR